MKLAVFFMDKKGRAYCFTCAVQEILTDNRVDLEIEPYYDGDIRYEPQCNACGEIIKLKNIS